MQQFHAFKPTPYAGSLGGRRVNPRWIPNLTYCMDLNERIPDYGIAGAGQTYIDYSPYRNPIQVTGGIPSTDWRYFPDAFGDNLNYVTSGGTGAIGPSSGTVPTPTTGISFATWYKPGSQGDHAVMLGRGNSTHNYVIVWQNAGFFAACDTTGAGTVFLQYPSQPVIGTWGHYACVWDTVTMWLYINGAMVTSAAKAGTPGSGNSQRWENPGWYGNTGNPQAGMSRFPMVWTDRIMGPSDIYDLYKGGPFMDSSIDPAITSFLPVTMPPPAMGGGGDYIKVRHGGTEHGSTARAATTVFTCQYDDYVIEADTTTYGAGMIGFLPTWTSRLQNREYVIVNTGTHDMNMYTADSSLIGSSSGVTVAVGTTKRFVAGTSKWQVGN